jgi:hypothetical protein
VGVDVETGGKRDDRAACLQSESGLKVSKHLQRSNIHARYKGRNVRVFLDRVFRRWNAQGRWAKGGILKIV